MEGQTLALDFVFPDGMYLETLNPVWAEVLLQVGPHNAPNPNGDYPYNQYVIFEPGSSAYLLDENGQRLDTPMSDWIGGTTAAPGPTLGVLATTRGNAGADMLAYPSPSQKFRGVHFDLVLPNTGETIYIGRIGMRVEAPSTGQILRAAAPSVDSTMEQGIVPGPEQPAESLIENQPSTSSSSVATSSYEANEFSIGFALPDLGGVSRATVGYGAVLTGYGRIQPNWGKPTPSGMLILGDYRPGYLRNETIVMDSLPIMSGRTFAEVSADGSVNTAIAIANPGTGDATVTFEIRNEQGVLYRVGSFSLRGANAACDQGSACNQLSRFLDDEPFLSGRGIHGTVTFTSTVPVSIFAVRGFFNERSPSDFLLTPLPVIDLSNVAPRGIQVLPHFSVGEGSLTHIVLVNPTGASLTGEVEFRDPFGVRIFVTIDGESYLNRLVYTVAPNSAQKFVLVNGWPSPSYGSVRVVPAQGTASPEAFAILDMKTENVTVSQTAVVPTSGTAFRMYAQLSPVQQLQTGLAVASSANSGGTVWLTLTGLDGSLIASTSFYVPAAGQYVDFLNSLLPSLAGREVQGVLRITTDLPEISVTAFRFRSNERQQQPGHLLTAFPPVLENAFTDSRARFFPYLVNGEGFFTEIILFSGGAGQDPAGSLSFFHPDGKPFDVGIH